jgi:hypothetical protein
MPLGDATQFTRATVLPAQAPNQNQTGIAASPELTGTPEGGGGASTSTPIADYRVALAQSPFAIPPNVGESVVYVDVATGNPSSANVVLSMPTSPVKFQRVIVKVANGDPSQAPVLVRQGDASGVEDPSSPGSIVASSAGQQASIRSGPGGQAEWIYDPGGASPVWRLLNAI